MSRGKGRGRASAEEERAEGDHEWGQRLTRARDKHGKR